MLRVTLLPPGWRLVTGALVATSLATLPTYLIALFVLPPMPPIVMIRSFALGTALPAVVAWAILRTFRGSADLAGDVLRLRRGDLEIDAPRTAIGAVRPWWIPLPSPGLTIRQTSGRRLPVGIAAADPVAVLELLARGGVDVERARRHPTAVAAHGRPGRGWLRSVAKFPGLGTIPATLLFYTHQHIAYGGTWGQYYLEGPLPYFTTYAQYWGTTVTLLLSWASFWRAGAELVVWGAAWAGDDLARRARRAVEIACAAAYYGGVPVFLALRYLG